MIGPIGAIPIVARIVFAFKIAAIKYLKCFEARVCRQLAFGKRARRSV